MSARGKVGEILEDLVRKYGLLSKKIDSSFGKISANQLVRQIDALTRIARLILSYRGVLELEERERDLTRILSMLREEDELDKQAMRAVRRIGGGSSRLRMVLESILDEVRRIKLALLGGGEDE